MVIIAWTVAGLASGLLARGLLPGRAKGFIITCVTGICGILIGGWTAASLPHLQTLPGFSRLSVLLTALIAGAIVLLARHTLTAWPGGSGRPREGVPAVMPARRPDAS